jgi:hypothetical protein
VEGVVGARTLLIKLLFVLMWFRIARRCSMMLEDKTVIGFFEICASPRSPRNKE